jgi:CubicO group peptidase (beta-lactamase class C family)
MSAAVLAPVLLAALVAAPPQDAPAPAAPASLAERADAFLQRCSEAGFHGTVLVARDGRPLLDRGYGLADREAGRPNAPATVHAIGSITKQFTAAAILKLQELGKLNVQDPLSRHLPGVPEDKAAITLHHLLTHSAGFPGAIGDDRDPVVRDDFVALALATPLTFAPGAAYEYSNVGYSLLGAVVERASGQGYEAFLRERLLEPAGLTHTGYLAPDWSRAELAVGYDRAGERWGTMLDQPHAADGPGWHLRCNGGLLSTSHDLLAWVEALRRHAVLSEASLAQMLAPHVAEGPGSGSHYGYGWALFTTPRGTRLVTHNGGNGIQFADVLWYADEGLFIALLSNASARGMQDLAWEIGRMAFDPAHEPRVPQPARALPDLPGGPAGERLRALCAVLASGGDDAALTAWLMANLGPGFLEDFPLERHLQVFRRLCTDVGAHRLEGVAELGPDEYELRLRSERDQAVTRLFVQLRPSDARIAGLGAERE